MTDHDDSVERLERANVDDARQRAAYKVEDDAAIAAAKVENDARKVAAQLTNEVTELRQEITVLQQIDHFKGKVYVVAITSGILALAAFVGLWWINAGMSDGVNAIRTDLEIHRIRNEASHDCLAEKMAKLPGPDARAAAITSGGELTRQFLQEFLGCVTATAPNIVPPNVPKPEITPRG